MDGAGKMDIRAQRPQVCTWLLCLRRQEVGLCVWLQEGGHWHARSWSLDPN